MQLSTIRALNAAVFEFVHYIRSIHFFFHCCCCFCCCFCSWLQVCEHWMHILAFSNRLAKDLIFFVVSIIRHTEAILVYVHMCFLVHNNRISWKLLLVVWSKIGWFNWKIMSNNVIYQMQSIIRIVRSKIRFFFSMRWRRKTQPQRHRAIFNSYLLTFIL